MDLQLTGKVALVTGASRGIGRAIAARLAREGMSVALAARDEARLRETAAMVEAAGQRAFIFPIDLATPDGPAAFFDAAMKAFGRVDLLVNNAGATARGDFLTLTEQQWADGFALKFFAAVRLSRAAWPELMRTRGAIVMTSGIGGQTGDAQFTIGGSVNAAMLNLTKALADRGVTDGVRVNAIAPGLIATDRLARRIATLAEQRGLTTEEATKQMAHGHAVARFGTPDEIAAAVAYLASDAVAGYTQGAVLTIDGGHTRTL